MGQAVKFGPLGSGFNNSGYNPVRAMFYDTIDKKLYAGGQFAIADGKTVWGVAVWYNNAWDSLKGGFTSIPQTPPTPQSFGPIFYKITRFQNKIYFAGAFDWVNGKNQYNFAIWNGNGWDYPLSNPITANSFIYDMVVHNNNLYVCGEFTMIGSTVCNYVAKFDGTNWQPVGDFTKFFKTFGPPAQIRAIEIYKDEIYIAGAFDDSTGTPRNIAKFNGTEWVNVGTGIQQGGIAWVQSMEEFNGKLHIAGYFDRTSQIPGESYVAWDGSSFVDVGDIKKGSFRNMYRSRDKLFILAHFFDSNHSPVFGVKFITKEKECVFYDLQTTITNTLNYSIDCLESINDSLVLGGLYKYLDTVQANSIGVVTNYENNSSGCLYVGLDDYYYSETSIRVYPNPTEGFIVIESGESATMRLTDLMGKECGVYTLEQKTNEIDLTSLPKGIYLCRIEYSKKALFRKLILK